MKFKSFMILIAGLMLLPMLNANAQEGKSDDILGIWLNEDKDAPIFAKCDYGIVGDIFDVVPALTEKL